MKTALREPVGLSLDHIPPGASTEGVSCAETGRGGVAVVGDRNAYDPNCPKAPGHYVQFYEGGRLGKAAVRSPGPRRVVASPGRGPVVSFSAASGRRLMGYVAAIDTRRVDPKRWVFVTLTYPREWPGDPRRWKRDLEVWWKRFERAWGEGFAAIWKLEPQPKRGAPHFHLIILPPARFLIDRRLRLWVSRSWYEVVASGDERHLRAGTNTERVRTYNGAISYAAKYATKRVCFTDVDTGELLPVGRFWGVLSRDNVPFARQLFRLDEATFYKVRRVLSRLWRGLCRGSAPRGFTVYASGETWARVVAWAQGEGVAVRVHPWQERFLNWRGRAGTARSEVVSDLWGVARVRTTVVRGGQATVARS